MKHQSELNSVFVDNEDDENENKKKNNRETEGK